MKSGPFSEAKFQLLNFSKLLASKGLLRDTAHHFDETAEKIGYTKSETLIPYDLTKSVRTLDGLKPGELSRYDTEYYRFLKRREFSFLLIDGGLIQIAYAFSGAEVVKGRLAYFQCPFDAPTMFYSGDLIQSKDTPQHFRFDYDPKNKKDILHPACHLTLSELKHCRIPVSAVMDIDAFSSFLCQHFLGVSRVQHISSSSKISVKCLTEAEGQMTFLSVPID